MSDIAIRIDTVSKLYRLGEASPYLTFREAVTDAVRRRIKRIKSPVRDGIASSKSEGKSSIWALRDVNLDVKHGDVLGVIGRNGAGKSTLLKILSRITEPTLGQIDIFGRVASLLEVGTGFHPELTGRENVYLNGSILGMWREEIRRKFDEIVVFSGVERFLDTPVKRYSSGMQVRLAFAVAAHLEPEILIIDEVLAVGDADFQRRCLGKMNEVASSGRTVIFVSHNMTAVESLCSTAALFEQGHVTAWGPVREVIDRYLDTRHELSADVDLRNHSGRVLGADSVLDRLLISDCNGNPITAWRVGDAVAFDLALRPHPDLQNTVIALGISGSRGERVLTLNSRIQYRDTIDVRGGAKVRCIMTNSRLVPGDYTLDIAVRRRGKTVDEVHGLAVQVVTSDVYRTGRIPSGRLGVVAPEVQWQVSTI